MMEDMAVFNCSADRHRQTEGTYRQIISRSGDFRSVLDAETEKLDRQQGGNNQERMR